MIPRLVGGLLCLLAIDAGADEALDRELIDALLADDLVSAHDALNAGADPNAVLSQDTTDHAICAAMDTRGTHRLQLLMNNGARIDDVLDSGGGLVSSLSCAIELYNPEAFEFLLERGADPKAMLCRNCPPHLARTPLTEALAFKRYPMALRLARFSEPDQVEIAELVRHLESSPYSTSHPWNTEREALIDFVRDQGVPIDPRPASVDPDGLGPRCVHSPRDLFEDGPPSVCPD